MMLTVKTAPRRVTRRCLSNKVGTANLDWPNLGFEFRETNGHVQYTWKNGSWSPAKFEKNPYFNMHVMSSAIHYGQGLFEGTKAHHCADGKTRLWNVDSNALRMQEGANRMLIPEVPVEMFKEACDMAVSKNMGFLPPYGTGGSLYLRPVLFGHGPQLGLQPAPEYTFAVLAIPVSSYYKGGLSPVSVLVVTDADRSAPLGVGNVKVSGNYGADILPSINARKQGFPTVLYLDAMEKKYIEEFSVSNFIGFKREKSTGRLVYVTPKSSTILMSCTNKMLMQLAPRLGFSVEHRPVEISEISEFEEVAGCGTAVVLMGIKDITYNDTVTSYDSIKHIEALYTLYRSIQFGETEDAFGWSSPIAQDVHTTVNTPPTPLPTAIQKIQETLLGHAPLPTPPTPVTVDLKNAKFGGEEGGDGDSNNNNGGTTLPVKKKKRKMYVRKGGAVVRRKGPNGHNKVNAA